jgi:hypothetical protein
VARKRIEVHVVVYDRQLLRPSGDRAEHVREVGVVTREGQRGSVVADDDLAVVTTDLDVNRVRRIADADR